MILFSFLVVFGAVAAYTFFTAPEYEARSTLLVNLQQSTPQLGELLGLETGNRSIANEVEILRSRTIAQRVAEALIVEGTVPGSGKPLTVTEAKEPDETLTALDVAQRLRTKYITVRPVSRDVDMIDVVARSAVPEEAAHIANLYAKEYVDYNQTSSRARMRASREFLSDVTTRFQEDLESAEGELRMFLDRERVVAPDKEAQQMIEQVTELQRLQYQTQYELGMAQTEHMKLQEELEQVVPNLAEQISSADNVMVDRLNQEIAQLEVEIERKYAKNPNLQQNPAGDRDLPLLLKQAESLKARRRTLAEQMVAEATANGGRGSGRLSELASDRLGPLSELQTKIMEKQIETAGLQARLDILQGQLREVQAKLGDIPRKEIILNSLERSLETREQLYVTLVQKLQESRIAEQSELGYVDVIDEAIVPEKPIAPRVTLNLMLGSTLGLILGMGMAFMRSALDNKVRKPEDLRKRGYSVLGVVQSMDRLIKTDFEGRETVTIEGHTYSSRLQALLNPLSPVAESYRRLRTNIQFSRPDVVVRTMLVSSPGPGEGKSVTSLNLGITIAQSGRRTVYVDTDMRRPVGHKMLGAPREPGVTDLLFSTSEPNFERFATQIDDFYLIPVGSTVPNPAEVLGSQKMRELIAQLKQAFDVVIIDTPPVLAVADALALASQVDAVLLVCSATETTWQGLERSVESLSAVGTRVTGVVLNRFDVKAAYGGYGYSYGYGYGYGYYDYYYGDRSTTNA